MNEIAMHIQKELLSNEKGICGYSSWWHNREVRGPQYSKPHSKPNDSKWEHKAFDIPLNQSRSSWYVNEANYYKQKNLCFLLVF